MEQVNRPQTGNDGKRKKKKKRRRRRRRWKVDEVTGP
jgi:hypothetical protein